MSLRQRAWAILEPASDGDQVSRRFDVAILTLIALNVIAVILGTVGEVQVRWGGLLDLFELFSVAVFTAEYLARLWACPENPSLSRGWRGRLWFASRPMSIVDLVAVLPFYLPFLSVDLRSMRVLRLVRILRVAKLGRYYSSLRLIARVFRSRKEELVLTTLPMGLLLIVASTALYYCENAHQPEAFSSIPATMWWAVTTLTTVGYGDMYPVTALGKSGAGIIAILGVGMFALPTGILGAGFVEEVRNSHSAERFCPHCGEALD
jgi:voltage-gated potassium channel